MKRFFSSSSKRGLSRSESFLATLGSRWARGGSIALLACMPGLAFGAQGGDGVGGAPTIRVLTLDASRTLVCGSIDFNIFNGNTFTIVRNSLLDTGNFGSSGTITREVELLPPVDEINPATLAGADVVLLSLNRVPLTSCELLDLGEFVRLGGGLFDFSNRAALRQGVIFGATSGGVGSGPLSIANPTSTVINGPFGLVTDPLGGLQFHVTFGSLGPNGSAILNTTGTVMAEFDFGLGRACLIGDEEWCAEGVVSGCSAGQMPDPKRALLFLNAFASVVPAIGFQYNGDPQCAGTFYCDPANPNSLGISATIRAIGSDTALDNDLVLIAEGMPLNQTGIFLNGTASGMYSPPNSDGVICLIGAGIGRYNGNGAYPGTGQILSTGSLGSFSLALDLTSTPTRQVPTAITAGQTWRFQAWYRDGMSNNFTDAITVQFQ